MSVPGYPYPPYPASGPRQADNPRPEATRSRASRSPPASAQRDDRRASRIPIKGWFVYGTNLIQALPQRGGDDRGDPGARPPGRRRRPARSEIAGYADVVLPEATYLERYDDLNVELFREPFVALRQPVVEPPGDQKPGWWIARELGAEARPRRLLPVEDDRGVPRAPARRPRASPRRAQGRAASSAARRRRSTRGRRRARVRDARRGRSSSTRSS